MNQSQVRHVSYAARSKVVRAYVQQYKKTLMKMQSVGMKYLVEIFEVRPIGN